MNELREKLAELCSSIRAGIAYEIFDALKMVDPCINRSRLFSELVEEEKEVNRKEADKILKLIDDHKHEMVHGVGTRNKGEYAREYGL